MLWVFLQGSSDGGAASRSLEGVLPALSAGCWWAGSSVPWECLWGLPAQPQEQTNKFCVWPFCMWEDLCFPVLPSPALRSKTPPGPNVAATSKVKYNKNFLFWLPLKDIRFVFAFVWFCINTPQFCLCKTNNSILGLYFKCSMGNEIDQLL